MTGPTLSIGEAALACGLNTKTIRYYEQIGLIPAASRTNRAARTGGNRVYSDADVDRLRFVHNARSLSLSLDDIGDLLVAADGGCPGEQPIYREKLADKLKAIDERMDDLRTLRRAVEALMSRGRAPRSERCTCAGCACMQVSQPLQRSGAPTLEALKQTAKMKAAA